MIVLFVITLVGLAALFIARPRDPQPVFRFRPVTDEFAKAVALLHRARFEVGSNLKQEITSFLTGHGPQL